MSCAPTKPKAHRSALGILGLIGLWQLAAMHYDTPLLVPPYRVAQAGWEWIRDGGLGLHAWASLQSILTGFGLAVILGVPLGSLMSEISWVRQMISPVVDLMRPIAALTLFPVLLLIFGIGITSKAIVILWTAWPAIVLNSVQALDDVPRDVLEAAWLDGASGLQVFWSIKLPLALPVMMTGMRIGLSGGWISIVAAEMLGGRAGLGYSVMLFSQTFRFAEMYAVIVVIGLLGLSMNLGMAWLQKQVDPNGVPKTSELMRFHDRAASYQMDTIRLHKERT